MHIPHMDGSKVSHQTFDILLRSWDIGVGVGRGRVTQECLAFFSAQEVFYLGLKGQNKDLLNPRASLILQSAFFDQF